MNRANLIVTSFPIWGTTLILGVAWLFARPGSLPWSYQTAIRALMLRLEMALALLNLKERHLCEDVMLRQAGFRNGVWIWETTFGLAHKTAAFLFVRLLNGLLQ